MIAKVTYVGFFPLGAEVSLRNTKIMQQEWNRCPVPVLAIGKKHFVDPMFEEVYYVKHDGQAVFFVASEYGLGHYHIFTFNEKSQEKLNKKIKNY